MIIFGGDRYSLSTEITEVWIAKLPAVLNK